MRRERCAGARSSAAARGGVLVSGAHRAGVQPFARAAERMSAPALMR
jgi:hypothetical protein